MLAISRRRSVDIDANPFGLSTDASPMVWISFPRITTLSGTAFQKPVMRRLPGYFTRTKATIVPSGSSPRSCCVGVISLIISLSCAAFRIHADVRRAAILETDREKDVSVAPFVPEGIGRIRHAFSLAGGSGACNRPLLFHALDV
jgi:hypothetical protein